jgi:hypothetical protein
MNDQKINSTPIEKKLLQSSPLSGIAVPIAIILVGALIIFGVTKMLSTGKDHRDLVEELHSKTFGNRWVAAYELSKYLAASKIPAHDIPWVVENLESIYQHSVDARTRNFIILALGTLKQKSSLKIFQQALQDADPQVQFNAIVVLGNFPSPLEIDWSLIDKLFQETQDPGLKQVLLYCASTHKYEKAADWARSLLQNSEKTLRYAAAITLIAVGETNSIPTLKEIFQLPYDAKDPTQLNGAQAENLKLNVLDQFEKYPKNEWVSLIKETAEKDSNVKVSTKAQQILNVLKF